MRHVRRLPWVCAVLAGIVLMMLYQPLLGFVIGLWCIDALLTAVNNMAVNKMQQLLNKYYEM